MPLPDQTKEKLPLSWAEKLMKLPVEEVVWEDHFSMDGWTHAEDKDLVGEIYITSVGYLLRETKTKIILIQNRGTNAQISGAMTILKKTVKSRTRLREAL